MFNEHDEAERLNEFDGYEYERPQHQPGKYMLEYSKILEAVAAAVTVSDDSDSIYCIPGNPFLADFVASLPHIGPKIVSDNIDTRNQYALIVEGRNLEPRFLRDHIANIWRACFIVPHYQLNPVYSIIGFYQLAELFPEVQIIKYNDEITIVEACK